jgi:photosystem II stability/assembly factor-like uncharacterized protein
MVAVGEQGTIVLSDDSGRVWRAAKFVGTSAALTQVRFADALNGWATGHFGVVLHTIDGGEHWKRVLDGEQAARTALLAAQASNDPHRIHAAELLAEDGPDKPLLDVHVDGPGTVTVVGAQNTVFRTVDGGTTWHDSGIGNANPKAFHLYGLARPGNVELLAGEAGLLVRRNVDGTGVVGLTPPFAGTFNGILAIDKDQVLLFGLRGKVFLSPDLGNTWLAASMPGEPAVNCAAVISGGRIALGDQAGRILISHDGAKSFRPINPGGVPVTGIAEAPNGALVATTLLGISLFPPSQIKQETR